MFVDIFNTNIGYKMLPQNLNKGGIGRAAYLCYAKSEEESAIVDIAILSEEHHETCPMQYAKINKSLNAGSFRDKKFLCIRHGIGNYKVSHYKPCVIDRFPRFDLEGSPLPPTIAMVLFLLSHTLSHTLSLTHTLSHTLSHTHTLTHTLILSFASPKEPY